MRTRSLSDLLDSNTNSGGSDIGFGPPSFGSLASGTGDSGGSNPPLALTPMAPVLPDESVESMAAVSSSGSGGVGSMVAETSSSGFTINLVFDAAAMAAPASFRAGIEQAAAILSATITNKITVNINIDYSGTGGGAASGPDNGQFVSYSTVRSDLIANAAPGDTNFNALPTGSTIQGQSQVAVWNAQLKLWGLISPTSTTTDDASATFATDINPNLLVGVALHELTHAIGRVPYGPQPDIFDFYRFTSAGTRLFTDNIPASSAYFSLDGGNTKLADFGVSSDPSDFLNAPGSNLTPNDAFDEFYSNNTLQSLTSVDLKILDALGFNTMPAGLAVVGNTAQALQGGAAVSLLTAAPSINDTGANNLSSATIKIANGSGSAVAGDKLFVNGVQTGTQSGVTVSWNATTDTLTLTGVASIATYQTLLSEITFQDTGTDASSGSHPVRTATWTINDGTNSFNATSTISIDRAPAITNSTATDVVGTTLSTTAVNGVLANTSDLDGDSLVVASVSDTGRGAGTIGTSLAGTYGHLTLSANGSYSYVADNTAALGSAPMGSHLQDVFSYTVSDGHGGTATASLTVTLDRAPMVTASNVALSTGHTAVAASSLLTAADPDGNTITTFAFENAGPGHFVVNGTVIEPNNQEIDLTTAQLAQLTYQTVAGAAADTVQVRVNDGTLWSNWTSFTVTPPSATIQTDGTTTLTEFNGDYFLDPAGGGTGSEVKQGGIAATPGSYVAVGAVQVLGAGYDLAWQMAGSQTFTIWSLDSQGNFVANIGNNLDGNSAALENFETIFGQDLNGDGNIGPPPPAPPTTISVDGITTLVQSANNYFLDVTDSGTLGPSVKQGGVAVTPGSFVADDAVQVSSGYDFAWKSGTTFTIWSLDSQGNFVANIGNNLASNSAALENFETIFGQDLNGDGTVGPPSAPPSSPPSATPISVDGGTTLVQSGNNYFLDVTGSSTLGPSVKQGGVALTPGSYVAEGAVQVAGGGYDFVWKMVGSETFTVWSLDSQGNFVANIGNNLDGNSAALENFETIFGQDLNGDGTIGPPSVPPSLPSTTTISIDGNTTLVQSGSNYFLDVTGSGTLGPSVKQGGVAVTPGSFVADDAVQVSSGYDFAWKSGTTFTIWSLDSQGNFVANIGNNLASNSAALENFETIFGQDLNGDGNIGPPPPAPPTTISVDGTTTLVQSGNNYFLDVTGSSTLGASVKQGGVAVTPGSYVAVGAVQVAGGGYDFAWKMVGSETFTIWSLDSQGNFVSNIGNNLAGNSTALENFETIFNQDFNANGTVGSTTPGQTAVSPPPDNFNFASSATGQTATQGNSVAMTVRDGFAFAQGPTGEGTSAPPMEAMPSSAALADIHTALTASHNDAFGHSEAHDAVLIWAHHSGFHVV